MGNKTSSIIIDPLTYSDIKRIAELHTQSLPDTRSSRMGIQYLQLLYEALLQEPSLHTLLVAKMKNEIVGVITVSFDLQKTQQRMSSAIFPNAIPHIIAALIRRTVSPQEIIQQMRFEKELISRFASPYATILTLFVHASYQRNGIGRMLVSATEHATRSQKISTLFVDTQIINRNAQAFYTRAGFKQQATIADSIIFSKPIQ